MRLIAFAFLCAFAVAGVVRYSKAAAPAPGAALAPTDISRSLSADAGAQAPVPLAPLAAPPPAAAPQVLRQKRRFAKAALRALKKVEAQEHAGSQKQPPKKQIARLTKPHGR